MRLFNANEVGVIMKKAAETSAVDDPGATVGLSIDEVHQVAADAGIDPAQVTRAVAELEAEAARSKDTFWGGPFSYSGQALAEREIGAAEWEEMLIVIREFFQAKGDVSARESVFEWSSPWGTTNAAHVTARKDNGTTKISVGWSGPLTGVPFYLPVPVVAIASLLVASGLLGLTAVPGVAFAVLATGLSFVAGRWALRRHLDAGFKKLQGLVTDLDRIASRDDSPSEHLAPQEAVSPAGVGMNVPLLELPDPDEEAYDEPHLESTRRHRSRS